MLILASTWVVVSAQGRGGANDFKLVSEWRDLEYAFPTPQLRQAAISSGQYVAGNGVPIDVDVNYRTGRASRIFVTIPRFTTGIPVTLGVVSGNSANNGPLVEPYPDYSWHSSHGQNCNGITSVFRIAIDECDRLWVLDTGRIGANQFCPPQLLIFNLENDQLFHRYKFPAGQYRPGTSLFITPVLDVKDPPPYGRCTNVKAYIADVTGYGILVYDGQTNRSWRVQNKLVYADPTYGTFTVAGESFDLMDGIIGMALSPRQNERDDRTLYFHALASIGENCVRTSVLNNATAWEQNTDSFPRAFTEIGSRVSQSAAEAMDRNGNLYFGLMDPIAIACWDSSRPYTPENLRIVVQNDQTLQFSSGVKVILNKKNREELWVLTCRFQKVMTGTINRNEVNFRIQARAIDELLGGSTKCTGSGISSRPFSGYGR